MSDTLFDRKAVDIFGDKHVGPLTHAELPGIQIRLVHITPELAANHKLLNAEAQRNHSTDSSATYAADMDAKEWVFIGDPIRFDIHGRMIDGQHRAEAIIKSGKAQWMIVITGLPEGVMRYVDMGRKRTYADTLRIRGIIQHVAVASLVRSIYFWDNGHVIVSGVPRQVNLPSLVRPSNAALDAVYDRMVADGKDPLIAVQAAQRLKAAISCTAPLKAVASVFHLLSRVDPFQAQEFFDRVADKIEGDQRNTSSAFAPNALRNRLARSIHGQGEWLDPQEWFHLFVVAWNAWRAGKDQETLKRVQRPIQPGYWAYPDGLAETVGASREA